MRELLLVASGVVLGIYFADWIEAHERRIAWRAADLAGENLEQRARTARRDAELNPQPTEPAPAATPA
jgi:hypothetical protein